MKNIILIIPLIAFAACAQPEGYRQKEVSKIAFGSCSRQSMVEKQLWKEVINETPDLWIWMGDIVYTDTEDMDKMKADYDAQKNHPDYQKLIEDIEVVGTWDDHDYGANDGGKDYPKRDESRELLFDFLVVSEDHPARQRKGAYQAYNYEHKGNRLKVILLDTRYFRDPLKKEGRNNIPDPTGQILGAEQWKWLEQQLSDSETDLFVVVSSIQLLANEHVFEKWGNFPSEKEKFFSLLADKVKVPLVVLSGDRHIGEISKAEIEGYDYPLYDITSSGLTHTWSKLWKEDNQYRVLGLVVKPLFTVMEIDWEQMSLDVQFIGKNNEVFDEMNIEF